MSISEQKKIAKANEKWLKKDPTPKSKKYLRNSNFNKVTKRLSRSEMRDV